MRELAIIGCGKMGRAILRGLLNASVMRTGELVLCDISSNGLEEWTGADDAARFETDAAAAARNARRVLIALKPGDAVAALRSFPGDLLGGKLVVSIAAGVTLATMRAAVPGSTRLVRAMPNTPALLGLGATAWAAGPELTAEDEAWVGCCLSGIGASRRVAESEIDAITGLSGSGPAYVFTVIEALADGGVLEGLPRDLALEFAARTVRGAAAMVLQEGTHPAALRDAVASPGGTTIAGLAALEAGGLRSALIKAVAAATARSRELGRM